MKVLIDTCVLVDALETREPFFDDAENIFISAASNEYDGIITARSVLDIYYLVHRYLKDDKKTRMHIGNLMRLFNVCDTTAGDIENAVTSSMKDYEDAVMSETAKRIGADFIVTRNIRDYRDSKVKAIMPSDFLMMLDGKKGAV